ncbi:hypothetical protein JCM14469_32870 [Desulfatiferula olefinivorans]
MSDNTILVSDLIERVRSRHPALWAIDLRFGDCTVHVQANRRDIVDDLSGYCRPFVVESSRPNIVISVHETDETDTGLRYAPREPDPGKAKVKEEYADTPDGRVVRKCLTGMVFVFGGGEHLAMGPCLANMNQVVNFINNRYIEWMLCRGCLLGHAAGVEYRGRGMALAGFSGMGKSTLSLHIMSRGTRFVSNDRLIIEENGKGLIMNGVAKLPRVNPGTVLNNPDLASVIPDDEQNRLRQISPADLWTLEQKYDVPIDRCFGEDRFILRAPMEHLVLLNWTRSDQPMTVRPIDPAQRKELLPAFMKTPGLFIHSVEGCNLLEGDADTYAHWLSRCRVWEFSGGVDFDKATHICLDILRGERE